MEALSPRRAYRPLRAVPDTALIRRDDPRPDDPPVRRGLCQIAADREPVVRSAPRDHRKAAGADDVSRTVAFASATGRDLAIRSGGHSLAGHSTADDGVVLDLSAMRGSTSMSSGASPGAVGLRGGRTRRRRLPGLATPSATPARSGWRNDARRRDGWLARKHGLASDSLVAAETCGRRVDRDRERDGAPGPVLGDPRRRRQFRRRHAVPVPAPPGRHRSRRRHDPPPTREVLQGLVPAAKAAPEETTTIAYMMPIPPIPMVPPEFHFKLGVIVMPVYAGDIEDGQRALEPFRALATPIADANGPMPTPRCTTSPPAARRRMPR